MATNAAGDELILEIYTRVYSQVAVMRLNSALVELGFPGVRIADEGWMIAKWNALIDAEEMALDAVEYMFGPAGTERAAALLHANGTKEIDLELRKAVTR